MKTQEEETTVEALIQPALGLSRIWVRVITGPRRGVTIELLPGVPIGIGKSSGNQVVLNDGAVSRYHVELTLRRGTIEVRDLGSTNGTYAGGVRVQHVRVRPGTRLTIGSNTIALDAAFGEATPEPAQAVQRTRAIAFGSVVREDTARSEERASGVFDAVRDNLPQRADLAGLPYRVARARALAAFELSYVRRLHGDCGGNAAEAARRAKLDQSGLLGLFRKHGLR